MLLKPTKKTWSILSCNMTQEFLRVAMTTVLIPEQEKRSIWTWPRCFHLPENILKTLLFLSNFHLIGVFSNACALTETCVCACSCLMCVRSLPWIQRAGAAMACRHVNLINYMCPVFGVHSYRILAWYTVSLKRNVTSHKIRKAPCSNIHFFFSF